MRKLFFFAHAKSKAQISFAATGKLINAFVFATQIVQYSSFTYIQNFKILAFFRECTGQFVSDRVGNPEDGFARIAAQLVHSISSAR